MQFSLHLAGRGWLSAGTRYSRMGYDSKKSEACGWLPGAPFERHEQGPAPAPTVVRLNDGHAPTKRSVPFRYTTGAVWATKMCMFTDSVAASAMAVGPAIRAIRRDVEVRGALKFRVRMIRVLQSRQTHIDADQARAA
jgi:hypothetical protein